MGEPVKIDVQVTGADKAAAEILKVEAAEQKLLDAMGNRAEKLRKLGADEGTINADPIIKLYEAKLDALGKGGGVAEQKIAGLNGGLRAMHGLLTHLPSIAGVLGLAELEMASVQLMRIGAVLSGITATTAAAIGGAALAAAPIIYDIATLFEIAKLNRDSMDMARGAVSKGGDSIERRLASRSDSGEISRERETELRARLQALRAAQNAPIAMRDATDAEKAAVVRQSAAGGMSGARPDVSNFQVPVETAEEKTRRLLAIELKLNSDVEAATGASHATLQAGELAHVSAMAAIDEAAAAGEKQAATSAMESVLKSRKSSQAQQFAALQSWNQAMLELIKRQAADEASVLDERERQRVANRVLITPGNKDELAKNDQEGEAIANARVLLNARTNAQIEQQNAQAENRTVATQQQLDRRLEEIQRQRDANSQASYELNKRRLEQDPSLSREDRVSGLRTAAQGALGNVDANIAKQQRLSDGADGDPAAQEKIKGELLKLDQQRLGILQEIHQLDVDNSFLGRLQANVQGLADSWSNLGVNAANFFTNTLGGAVSSISQATAHSIIYAKSLGDALGKVGLMIEEQLLTAIIQLPIQWLLSHTLMAGISKLFNATEVAGQAAAETAKTGVTTAGTAARLGVRTGETVHATALVGTQVGVHAAGETTKTGTTFFGSLARGAIRVGETLFHALQSAFMLGFHVAAEAGKTAATVIGTAIRIPLVMGEVLANIALGAIEAFSAVANIPYVGPFLGIALIGTVLALGAELIAKGFATGGMVRGPGSGNSDSIPIKVSNGEHVTQASSVSRLGERFMAGINAGVVDLSALNAGASVLGAAGSGGAGGGSVTGGRMVQNFHFGFHTDESSTIKHLDTVEGRKFLVNASRQTVREVTGKG